MHGDHGRTGPGNPGPEYLSPPMRSPVAHVGPEYLNLVTHNTVARGMSRRMKSHFACQAYV